MARRHQKSVAICLILVRYPCQLVLSLSRLRASGEYAFEHHLLVGLALLAVERGLPDLWDQMKFIERFDCFHFDVVDAICLRSEVLSPAAL